MQQIGNGDVLNFMLDSIAPFVIDSALENNITFQILSQKRDTFKGKTFQVPVKFKQSALGGFYAGADVLQTAVINTTVNLVFTPSFGYTPVTILQEELAYNNTPGAVLDYVKYKTVEAGQELADILGTATFGDGTSYSGKAMLGIPAAVKTSGSYGGLDYSVYTALKSAVDSTTTLSTFTLASLDTMYSALASGNYTPDLIATTKAIYNKIKSLMQPTQTVLYTPSAVEGSIQSGVNSAGSKLSMGSKQLEYNGMRIVIDSHCPAGKLYMLTTEFWQVSTLDMTGTQIGDPYVPFNLDNSILKGQYDKNMETKLIGFSRSPWIPATNQAGKTSRITFSGQLICTKPKFQGAFTALS